MNAVKSAGRDLRGWIERHLDAHWHTSLDAVLGAAALRDGEAELIATLELLAQLRADSETFVACILHAAHQAGAVDAVAASVRASPPLRELIEGQQAAEKVWSLHASRTHAGSGAEGLRRLLLAIIRDLRVVYILLARQLVRMRAADALAPERRRALAQLTVDIHAPLANRLGIWQLKWELEDLAFRHLQPEAYQRIARLLDDSRGERERFIARAQKALRAALVRAGIDAQIAGRSKHSYSIWKKMQR
jgi:GTP pyrophosphokinase